MKQSAGLLLYNIKTEIEFFLVHPGGPYFTKKNEGWWTIPKGELLPGELPLHAAIRECEEETGFKPTGPFTELQPIIQKGGKKVFCWACEAYLNPSEIVSNKFEIEWPPKSAKVVQFPEIDKAAWFTSHEAEIFINDRQKALLLELKEKLGIRQPE